MRLPIQFCNSSVWCFQHSGFTVKFWSWSVALAIACFCGEGLLMLLTNNSKRGNSFLVLGASFSSGYLVGLLSFHYRVTPFKLEASTIVGLCNFSKGLHSVLVILPQIPSSTLSFHSQTSSSFLYQFLLGRTPVFPKDPFALPLPLLVTCAVCVHWRAHS